MKPEETAQASGEKAGGAAARRQGSLAQRLVRVAALWSVLALAAAGFVLVGLYQQAGERAFDAQLDQHIKSLLASVLPPPPEAGDQTAQGETETKPPQRDPPALQQPKALGEPRFSLPLSGWYWSVAQADGTVLFTSPSLVGDALVLPDLQGQEKAISGFAAGPGGEEVRYLRRIIKLGDSEFLFTTAIETGGYRQDVRSFARSVAITLIIVGIGLVGAIFWQVNFGLRPLTRLQASLADVREGTREEVDESMPRELAPLAMELNALIHSNREVVERARTHVGNLAHALKTPISVLMNEARSTDGPLADKVREQTGLMQTQVQHHLERARLAAQRRVIGVACEVAPVTERLARAMGKIYQRQGIEVIHQAPSGLKFRGEAQDLEEMAGNLLDNACKWAASRVSLEIHRLTESGRSRFELIIEDDGPGLTDTQMREALKRGKRLDETVPGTGLGLSIVADLAALYGGSLHLARTSSGGLSARLILPAAEERRG